MSRTAMRNALVRGDLVAPIPLAPGYPCWMPHGTRLVERVEHLVRESVSRHLAAAGLPPCEEFDVQLLFAAEPYAAKISDTLTYRNMYSLEGRPELGLPSGRSYLVRPDNVLSVAARMRDRPVPATVLCCGSLWRADTERMIPAVRDRHVWHAVELVQWLPDSPDCDNGAEAQLELSWAVLGDVVRALALPQIYYGSPGLRDHSDRCLLSAAAPTPDTITLTSTLFHLSRALSERLGLRGTLVDLGFTAKLLAIALLAAEDEHGLLMPTKLAPDQVVVAARHPGNTGAARRIAARLSTCLDRVAVASSPWPRVLRTSRRRGVPLLILVDDSGVKLISRHSQRSEDLATDPVVHVRTALTEHDNVVTARARRVLDEAFAREETVRLIERDAPVPDGWHRLGILHGIGETPANVQPPADAPWVLSRSRRLY